MVAVLDSPVVRREIAARLTQELARAGNRQAVNFGPAFELAVEVAADTDTFRSIFRTAVRRVHEALLAGEGSGAGLDLSDSIAIITSTLRLPGDARSSPGSGGLGNRLRTSPAACRTFTSGSWRTSSAASPSGASC